MPGSTVSETPFELLRRDILRGEFAPGDPLRLSSLSQRYNVSATPLREALSRLEEKRLVLASRNKGWRVAPVSIEQLEDIAATRITLERAMLEDSILNGDIDWESDIVAAHHRLSQSEPPLAPEDAARRERWVVAHDAFHVALLSGVRSERLLRFYADLLEEMQRYHDKMFYPPRVEKAERLDFSELDDVHSRDDHRDLMQAVLDRDIVRAKARMQDHVERTLAVYRAAAFDEPGALKP